MRKEILDALKTKFAGVSDAVLGRIADKLAKTATTAEEVTQAVEKVSFNEILQSYGDSRATEAQQTAVANYEKKHGLKDGKKVGDDQRTKNEPEDKNNNGGGEDVPSWAKALLDSNKALTERLNAMDKDRTTASRKQQLSKIIEKLPEDIRKAYARTSVESLSEEEFTTMLSEVSTEVEGIQKGLQTKGAVFGKPIVGNTTPTNTDGTQKASEKEVEDVVNRLHLNV